MFVLQSYCCRVILVHVRAYLRFIRVVFGLYSCCIRIDVALSSVSIHVVLVVYSCCIRFVVILYAVCYHLVAMS